MTLKELKQRVDTYYEMNEKYHDLEVCIPRLKEKHSSTVYNPIHLVTRAAICSPFFILLCIE